MTRWCLKVAQARQKTIDLIVRAFLSANSRVGFSGYSIFDFIIGKIPRAKYCILSEISIKPKTTDPFH